MLSILSLIFFIFQVKLYAQTSHELERINFYPNAKAFVKAEYTYQLLHINTPQESVSTKEVHDYKNIFALTYAYHFNLFFLGVKNFYESASENVVKYGIPITNQYQSQGFKEPEFFLLSRLRKGSNKTANIDLLLSYAKSFGGKEVGRSSANRLNGGDVLNVSLSHGLIDEDWEFRNSFQFTHHYAGEEHNTIMLKRYELGPYALFTYLFSGQYAFSSFSFINAGVGIDYRSVQRISDGQNDKRELQAGTGSVFNLGFKRSLSEWILIEFLYSFRRNSYFVKNQENYDGLQTQHNFMLSLIQAF